MSPWTGLERTQYCEHPREFRGILFSRDWPSLALCGVEKQKFFSFSPGTGYDSILTKIQFLN